MTDFELVREYEPVVRYTDGELFYPSAVDPYLRASSLWLRELKGTPRLLAGPGMLDSGHMSAPQEVPEGHSLYLRFVEAPLSGLAYQQWLLETRHHRFRAAGRMARVPMISRLAGNLLDLSLLVRGTLPGGTTAAAEVASRGLRERDPRRVYYYRTLREGGWTVLHYMFFYHMNNWRSTFFGANDHEGDWEQVFVFLYDAPEGPRPRWLAYASHDFFGDEVRRRWDDPTLTLDGHHPVVYAGAGSHASYFERGEYMMSTAPAALIPAKRVLTFLRRLWTEQLGMGVSREADARITALLSIPFVDYARGDGPAIGPGHEAWTPVEVSDETPWIADYRGLWGLDTRDPLGGERAPSGPKFHRNGTVRRSWYDPVGWAGLDKVLPPQSALAKVEERLAALTVEADTLEIEIEQQRRALRDLAIDEEALRATAHFATLHRGRRGALIRAEAELQSFKARQAEIAEVRSALATYSERIRRGDWGPPDAHLVKFHRPEPALAPLPRAMEVWAAFSAGIAVLLVVLLLLGRPDHWTVWITAVAVAFGGIEAMVSRTLADYLLNLAVLLAAISTVILVYEFWLPLIAIAAMVIVALVIRDNLREVGLG